MSECTGVSDMSQRLRKLNENFEPNKPRYLEFNRQFEQALSNGLTIFKARINASLLGTGQSHRNQPINDIIVQDQGNVIDEQLEQIPVIEEPSGY